MTKGFFKPSTLAKPRESRGLVPLCGACGLSKGCRSPKMPVSGRGQKGILLVGEAPGEVEDRVGKQFVGPAGQVLRRAFSELGIDIDRDCWKTNSLICRPPKNKTPTESQIGYCQPNLLNAVRELAPNAIIPLGASAVRSVLSYCWGHDVGAITRWIGWAVPYQKWNCWICPTYHPSYVMRSEAQRSPDYVPGLFFKKHLKRAVKLSEKPPWKKIPDYKRGVTVEVDHMRAAKYIRKIIERGGTTAFDYETNMLKPDHPKSRIYSCSICWEGKRTVAYPWYGEAIKATKEYLVSPLPKIASNLKFEERWTKSFIPEGVNNWLWDTMLAAHIINNQRRVTSVKFQAFVLLGVEPWNEHIEPFLKSPKGSVLNRIGDIDLGQLLLYNGLDSLYEYKVAEKQREVFGG